MFTVEFYILRIFSIKLYWRERRRQYWNSCFYSYTDNIFYNRSRNKIKSINRVFTDKSNSYNSTIVSRKCEFLCCERYLYSSWNLHHFYIRLLKSFFVECRYTSFDTRTYKFGVPPRGNNSNFFHLGIIKLYYKHSIDKYIYFKQIISLRSFFLIREIRNIPGCILPDILQSIFYTEILLNHGSFSLTRVFQIRSEDIQSHRLYVPCSIKIKSSSYRIVRNLKERLRSTYKSFNKKSKGNISLRR